MGSQIYHFNEVWKQLHRHIIFQDFNFCCWFCPYVLLLITTAMLIGQAGTSETILKLDTRRMIVAIWNWFSGFRDEDFWKLPSHGRRVMTIANFAFWSGEIKRECINTVHLKRECLNTVIVERKCLNIVYVKNLMRQHFLYNCNKRNV